MERYELNGTAVREVNMDFDAMKAAIKKAGGSNPRVACQFGWSNQPQTLRFSAESSDIARACATACVSTYRDPEALGSNLFAWDIEAERFV